MPYEFFCAWRSSHLYSMDLASLSYESFLYQVWSVRNISTLVLLLLASIAEHSNFVASANSTRPITIPGPQRFNCCFVLIDQVQTVNCISPSPIFPDWDSKASTRARRDIRRLERLRLSSNSRTSQEHMNSLGCILLLPECCWRHLHQPLVLKINFQSKRSNILVDNHERQKLSATQAPLYQPPFTISIANDHVFRFGISPSTDATVLG